MSADAYRMLSFGGTDSLGVILDELWRFALDSRTWTKLVPSAGISALTQVVAAYDPSRDRMLVFNTRGGVTTSNQMWELPLAEPLAWHLLSSTGYPPYGRYGPAMDYDPGRDRMLVPGGASILAGTIAYDDLWEFSFGGTGWKQLQPAWINPGGAYRTGAVFDPA